MSHHDDVSPQGEAPSEGAPPPESSGRDPTEDALGEAVAAVIGEIREIRTHLDRLAKIRVDRARVRIREGAFTGAKIALLVMVGVTAAIVATLEIQAGLSDGLTALFGGRAWAGRLAGGTVFFVVVAAAFGIVAGRLRRKNLGRMRESYDPETPPAPDEQVKGGSE